VLLDDALERTSEEEAVSVEVDIVVGETPRGGEAKLMVKEHRPNEGGASETRMSEWSH